MTEIEIMKVRMLLAQARATSLRRQIDEMDKAFEKAIEIANYWRAKASGEDPAPVSIEDIENAA